MGRGRGKEGLEFGEDEACVEVDVSTYREEWDSAVCGAEGGNVWAGHGCWLHALFKWYSAEVEVPCYSSGIGREAVMVEDYFSALIHCVYCFDAGVQTQLIEADWNTVKT